MATRGEKVAAILRAVADEIPGDLCAYMASAALRDLAESWDTYGDEVSPSTVTKDIEGCVAALREMAIEVVRRLREEGIVKGEPT